MGFRNIRRRWRRRVLVVAGAALGFLGIGVAAYAALVTIRVTIDPSKSPLAYQIHTKGGAGCGTDRTITAQYGVPTLVDIGGSALADISVQAIPIPTGAVTVLWLSVTRLTTAPTPAMVEAILAPSGAADPTRVGLGYDTCSSGAPDSFTETLTSAAAQLTLSANTNGPTNSLTLLGSMFQAGDNGVRNDPTALRARLSPVPKTLSAIVDLLPNDGYRATVRPDRPIELGFGLTHVVGAASTEATGTIRTIPPDDLVVSFDATHMTYSAASPLDEVTFDLRRLAPAQGSTPATTNELHVGLLGLPKTASLARAGTKLTFDAPGGIASSTVRYATFPTGAPPGVLTIPPAPEYLTANIDLDSLTGETRVRGLSHAEIDAGDPVVVDVIHTAGKLGLDVVQRVRPEPCPACIADLTPITRHLTGTVADAPAQARITYSPATGAFAYDGSAVIGDITATLESTRALVDVAKNSLIHLVSVPTGLTGRLDSTGKTLTAKLTGGALTTLEAQVWGGANDRLPEGTDGVLVHDHAGVYDAFVRVSGLSDATVGWGDTQSATLTHTAGPFQIDVNTDDPDLNGKGVVVDGHILDLPATAHVEYTPGEKHTNFAYAGSDIIGRVTIDVVKQKPFFDDADTAHVVLTDVPSGMTLDTDDATHTTTAQTPTGAITRLEVELCSATACRPAPKFPPLFPPDGVWLSDRNDGYDAFVRVSGLSSVNTVFGRTPAGDLESMTIGLTHASGPFEVHSAADKIEVVELPWTTVHIPYLETVDVEAHDLPATVALTYSAVNRHLTYTGSTTINSLVIDYAKGGLHIAGRGRTLHLNLAGVESGIDFNYGFGDQSDSAVLDMGPTNKIEHVTLELLSDRGLLALPDLGSQLAHSDGAVLWDLDDGDANPDDPMNDPWVIQAKVTNVRHFAYAASSVTFDGPDGETFADKRVDLVRVGEAPALHLNLTRLNIHKPYHSIAGLPNDYRYEFLNVDYDQPPDTTGFHIKTRSAADALIQLWIEAWGSGDGGGISAHTNLGALDDLQLDLGPIAAGTDTSPGLTTCFAPHVMSCVPVDTERQDGSLSFALTTKVPITLDAVVVIDKMTVWLNDVKVTSQLEVGKEGETEGANSTVVFLNSAGTPVQGDVLIYNGDTLDKRINATPGTVAVNRFVEIENSGVNDKRNHGFLACPHDFSAEGRLWGREINLNDDLCTTPTVTSISTDFIPADGLEHVIDVYGTSFALDSFDNDGNPFEGTHVDLLNSFDHPLDNPTVTWVERLDIGHMRLHVVAQPGTAGQAFISLRANTDSRRSDESGTECECSFVFS